MSPATMDRHLTPYRKLRGKTTTKAWFKHKIPIELLTAPATEPGFVEADTVAHCGNSTQGTYVNSLTMTDLYSGWTENRALWGKKSVGMILAVSDIERAFPFLLNCFASDNGSEFLNDELYTYLRDRHAPVG